MNSSKKMIANNEKKIDGNFMVFKKDQSFLMMSK